MAKKNTKGKTSERKVFGITILKAAHKEVRKLKKEYEPEIHGHKLWNSSYLIMDYLKGQGMPRKTRVMELGCGWGLVGIYCAKKFDAQVTGVDADAKVFPYLELHAGINGVEVQTRRSRFENLKKKDLAGKDLLLGADICFWDEMVAPLYRVIHRGMKAGMQQVIIADPGRPPFDEVCERCQKKFDAEVKEWEVDGRVQAHGWLLIVGSLPGRGRP